MSRVGHDPVRFSIRVRQRIQAPPTRYTSLADLPHKGGGKNQPGIYLPPLWGRSEKPQVSTGGGAKCQNALAHPASYDWWSRQMTKTDVRIVSGELRGRKVPCRVHPGLRPTPQMVREALFSILGDAVPDRPFYDVFAGTGVVGLEAISRGASVAKLIEREPGQVADIQKCAIQFGIGKQVQVLRADAYRWAAQWVPSAEPVNLFLSPPFPDLEGPKCEAFLVLVQQLFDRMTPCSVLAVQVELGFPHETLADAAEWDVRTYGRNQLLVRVKLAPEPLPSAE